MFATILGALPPPPLVRNDASAADDEAIRALIGAQDEAGIEPMTDGRHRWRGPLGPLRDLAGLVEAGDELRAVAEPRRERSLVLAEWQFAAGLTQRAVKQALPGPYSAGRRIDPGPLGRKRLTLALAEAVHAEVTELTAAGCPMIEIDEPDATEIGTDDHERQLFIDAHRRLTSGLSGAHLSLSLTGGNADTADAGTFVSAPYASYAVDLINGPDNWRLVTSIPGERGIICGALDSRPGSDDAIELLAWAAHYAASANSRGLERVGLAVVPGLDREDWPTVQSKLAVLGRAAKVAGLSGDALAASLDPRSVDIRSAALGRYDPERPRRRLEG